jgi:hypothetical protein
MMLVKVPVTSARGMLLTDTFKLAGRAAMIIEPTTPDADGENRTHVGEAATGARAALQQARA